MEERYKITVNKNPFLNSIMDFIQFFTALYLLYIIG